MNPQPGDRRPREGRCERCDRPLSDEVWVVPEHRRDAGWRVAYDEDSKCPARKNGGYENEHGDHIGPHDDECTGESIDWRARALAAEARVEELTREVVYCTGDDWRCHACESWTNAYPDVDPGDDWHQHDCPMRMEARDA